MVLNLNIKDEHVNDFIKLLMEKNKERKLLIQKLEQENRETNALILELKQSLKGPEKEGNVIDGEDYSEKWPWIKKIEFAITLHGKPATTKEIVRHLSSFDPDIAESQKTAISSVSSTLSVKGHEKFLRTSRENGEFEYYIKKDMTEEEKTQNEKDIHDMIYGKPSDDDLPF